MSRLRINFACCDYDRMRPLIDGVIKPEGIDFNYINFKVGDAPEIFWRMFQYEEFDAAELSTSGYILERSRGNNRFIAIPVFPSRTFRHSITYINTDAGIKRPEDLKGKEVGVPEYHMTAALWVRGLLHHEYGVKASDVIWRTGGHEEAGRKERVELKLPREIVVKPIPESETLAGMLERGAISALVSPHPLTSFIKGHPKIKRLFPDYRAMEEEYYKKTKIFPIMHIVVIKESIYRENRWVAMELFKAFRESKDLCLKRIWTSGYSLPWLMAEVEREKAIIGQDLWPYGVQANKHVLEAMVQFSYEQGLAERIIPLEELFAKETLVDSKM